MRHAILLALGFAALIISSCTASFPNQPSAPATVAGLHILYVFPTASVVVGRNLPLRAVVFDTDGAYRDVTPQATWTSSDAATMAVAAPGALQPTRAGLVQITATYQGFATSLSTIVTASSPTYPYLELFPLAAPTGIGSAATTNALMRDGPSVSLNVTTQAVWSSSDTRVATVSQGQVSAVGIGTVEISASYGGFTSSYRFSVYPKS